MIQKYPQFRLPPEPFKISVFKARAVKMLADATGDPVDEVEARVVVEIGQPGPRNAYGRRYCDVAVYDPAHPTKRGHLGVPARQIEAKYLVNDVEEVA